MVLALLFLLFGGIAIGCAISMVIQRNPLYSAISLIGVFVSLACLYVLLSAPFIAAVQVIVYAGAIMVLVVFVIMLLNVEEEARRTIRLGYLVPVGVLLAGVLVAEVIFTVWSVSDAPLKASNTGLTSAIGTGLFTVYLLPFEVTSILLLMAMVGAISLARRASITPNMRVIPGAQVLTRNIVDPTAVGDATTLEAHNVREAELLMGEQATRHDEEG
jgi:NADH-quinone oxidoreductase subunit J